jgi:hypothetical protein
MPATGVSNDRISYFEPRERRWFVRPRQRAAPPSRREDVGQRTLSRAI